MIVKHRIIRFDDGLPDLSDAAVENCRASVKNRYPQARWISGDEFGRIVAGSLLLSLRFSLIDPLAEDMAWRDASLRLGDKIAERRQMPSGQ
ncbi:MAG: hypothetical protein JWN70_7090 [Planctomycetaceae bacterium]|nr:hypothetical protein [Planctomycetaceae bacterium]